MRFPGRRFALLFLTVSALLALTSGMPLMANEDAVLAQINKAGRPAAPDLEGAVAWINTDKPLTMAELRGKIVLLDFWTFG